MGKGKEAEIHMRFKQIQQKSVRYIEGCAADMGQDQILNGLGTKIRKQDFVLEEVRCHCWVLRRGITTWYVSA